MRHNDRMTITDINVSHSSFFKYKFCKMLHTSVYAGSLYCSIMKRRAEYNSKIYYTLKYILRNTKASCFAQFLPFVTAAP